MDKERLITTFLELVQIDSPSGEESSVAKNLVKRLSSIGVDAKIDKYGNVIGFLSGKGEPLILNAHMDTVEPGRGIKPVIVGDKITSDKSTILGGDCKSGLSIILETLSILQEKKSPHPPLEIVFTREEETGLTGARKLDYKKIKAKRGLTFDGPGPVGTIIVAAPFYNDVDITVVGKGAHAGVEPENGISAIKITSEIISNLTLGRIDDETTANIGLIAGGTARNAVPETVKVSGEIRSRDLKKLINHTAHFQEVVNTVKKAYSKAEIIVEISRQFDGFEYSNDHPVVAKILSTLKELNIKPELRKSGGGTDVNIFITHGLELVCVGTGVYEPHTTREYVKISEMVEAVEFCRAFLSS